MAERFIFDIETKGFLDVLNSTEDLLIITARELNSGENFAVKLDECEDFARRLYEADQLIGHNILTFDFPALQKCLGWWDRLEDPRDFDTLIATRLIYSNLFEEDMARGKANRNSEFPKKLWGSHSLKAWGMRTGTMKDDFEGDFSLGYSDEMFEYAKQDVVATTALYDLILSHNYSSQALDLEMAVARLMARQERIGFPFDVTSAEELTKTLMVEQSKLHQDLQAAFPPWETYQEFIPKVNNKTRGYVRGVPFKKTTTVIFNPSSRDHIADRLQTVHGWKPQDWTPAGKPKVDETVLMGLPYPEAELLARNFLIDKRLGQLATGQQAWLKKQTDGAIHGRVITNGCVSSRATHSSPNIAQVPGNRALYGTECRSLFRAPEGRVLVGSDASGLELRALAHMLALAGDPSYAEEVVNGDVHTRNQEMAGLPTRDAAKTFIYALLYGGGDTLIGQIVGGGAKQGKELKDKFFSALPALGRLIAGCKKRYDTVGYLKGLDGRKLHIRSPHGALNLLLQSAGSLVCKQWLVEMDSIFQERGLDVLHHAWVHDEVQLSCPTDQAESVGQACQDAMRNVQKVFNFKCQLDTDFNVGLNWSETH